MWIFFFFVSQVDDRKALNLSDGPHCGESALRRSLGPLVTSLAAPSDNLPATHDVSAALMWIYDVVQHHARGGLPPVEPCLA